MNKKLKKAAAKGTLVLIGVMIMFTLVAIAGTPFYRAIAPAGSATYKPVALSLPPTYCAYVTRNKEIVVFDFGLLISPQYSMDSGINRSFIEFERLDSNISMHECGHRFY